MVRNNPEKTSGGVSIRYVVMSLKNRMKDFSATDYKHLEQLVIDAFQYLNIFTLDTIEVVYLNVDETNSIELPRDYIDYTKIGVIDSCGKLWTLTLNRNLVRLPGEECGIPLNKAIAGCCETNPSAYSYPTTGYYFAPHFHNGSFIQNRYGLGGGFNKGYYNIDRQGRYLIISGLPQGTTVVLEYKSTGISITGGTVIPRKAVEAVIAKVMWIESEYGNIRANPQYWQQRFYEEEAILQNLEYKLTMQEYLDEMYKVWKQTPKR